MKIICVTCGFCVVFFFLYLISLNNISFLSFSHFYDGNPRIMQVTKQMERMFFKGTLKFP